MLGMLCIGLVEWSAVGGVYRVSSSSCSGDMHVLNNNNNNNTIYIAHQQPVKKIPKIRYQ